MADKPKAGKPSNPWHDVLWFFGIMAAFFFLWVWGGGPERAKQNPPSPVLKGTTGQVAPAPTNNGNPSRPQTQTNTGSTSGSVQSGQGSTSGQIQVTPL